METIDKESNFIISQIDNIKLELLKTAGEDIKTSIKDDGTHVVISENEMNHFKGEMMSLNLKAIKDKTNTNSVEKVIFSKSKDVKLWKNYNRYSKSVLETLSTYNERKFSFNPTMSYKGPTLENYIKQFEKDLQSSKANLQDDESILIQLFVGLLKPNKVKNEDGDFINWMEYKFKNATITAVEPESSIADVAQNNFNQDLWHGRITLQRVRIQDLVGTPEEQFDLVVCNPPYFQNSMPSSARATEVARHNSDLSPEEIYAGMRRHLTLAGSAWLSFPEKSAELWFKVGKECGLHLTHQITLREHPTAEPHIVVAGWSRIKPVDVIASEFFYRIAPQGALSPWMKSMRKKWFPAEFNKNMYAVDP